MAATTATQKESMLLGVLPRNHNGCIELKFSDDFNQGNAYMLLELTDDVEDALCDDGESVYMKGHSDDTAMLFTSCKSYHVKMAATSNANLIVTQRDKNIVNDDVDGDDVKICVDILAQTGRYMELRAAQPHYDRLRTLLEESAFDGDVSHDDNNDMNIDIDIENEMMMAEEKTSISKWSRRHLYTFDELLDKVQASANELHTALINMGAFEMNGAWCILTPEYERKVFDLIITVIIESDWSFDCVSITGVLESLSEMELRPEVVRYCIRAYGTPADTQVAAAAVSTAGTYENVDFAMLDTQVETQLEPMKESSLCKNEIPNYPTFDDYFQFSAESICRFRAVEILQHTRRFNYNSFLKIWADAVPVGMTPNAATMLHGVAITEGQLDMPQCSIVYFPLSELPTDPVERFRAIFRCRERWYHDELVHYINDLASERVTISALLLKHCRTITDKDGKRIYNSRYPL